MMRTDAMARTVLDLARAHGIMIATVESCTGGMIAAALTDIAGSSQVVERGFVTYSNDAKTSLVGVPKELIETFGAVSEPVARAMAEGALAAAPVGAAVSVTGIAGPGGGTAIKPVGRVHIAAARVGRPTLHLKCDFSGCDRSEVRARSVDAALQLLAERLAT